MTHEGAPQCEHHDDRVAMELRTLHSDSSRPDTVVGLYECPQCGHEQRQPIATTDEAA